MKRKSLSCFTESHRQTQDHSTVIEQGPQQRTPVDSPIKKTIFKEGFFSKKSVDNCLSKESTKELNEQNELSKVSPKQQTGCFLKRVSLFKTGPNWMIVGKNSVNQANANSSNYSWKNIPREQSLNSSVKNTNTKRSFHLQMQQNNFANSDEEYFKRTDALLNQKQQSSEKSQSIISLVTSSSSFTNFPNNPTTPVQFINPKHIIRSDVVQAAGSTKQSNTNLLRQFPQLSKPKISEQHKQITSEQLPNSSVFQSINSDLKLSSEESMMFRGRQRSTHSPSQKHSLSPLNKLTYSPNKKARTLSSFWCEQICLSSFPSNTPKNEMSYNIQPYPSNPTISIQALTPSNNRQSICQQTNSLFSPKKIHHIEPSATINPNIDLSVGQQINDSNKKQKLKTTVLFISKKHKDCKTLCSPQDKDVLEVKISSTNEFNTQNITSKQPQRNSEQQSSKVQQQQQQQQSISGILHYKNDLNKEITLEKTKLMENEVVGTTSKVFTVTSPQQNQSEKPGYPVQQQFVLQTFLQMKNIKLRSRNKVISNTLKQQLFPEKGLETKETIKKASLSPQKQKYSGQSNFQRNNQGYDGRIVSESDFQIQLDKEESPSNKSIDNEEEDFYNYTQVLKNASKYS